MTMSLTSKDYRPGSSKFLVCPFFPGKGWERNGVSPGQAMVPVHALVAHTVAAGAMLHLCELLSWQAMLSTHDSCVAAVAETTARMLMSVPPIRQWSWPLSLPPQLFGIFPQGVLVDRDESVPWAADLEQRTYTGRVSKFLPRPE